MDETQPGTQVTTGTIVRDERGRFLPGTRPHNLITPAIARDYQARRVEQYRRAAARGVLREAVAIDPHVSTPADAWALLVGRTYQQAMDSQIPRPDALDSIGAAIGARPTRSDRAEEDGSGATLHISEDVAARILDALVRKG